MKRGLLKAAKTAGAWIFTSGINTGVVKHVGDALFMRSRSRSNIVIVGIAPWGVIQGRKSLKGENVCIFCSKRRKTHGTLDFFSCFLANGFLSFSSCCYRR